MVSWKSESCKWAPPKANGTSWLFVVLSIALFMLLKCSVIDAGAQSEPPPDWCKSPCECAWIDGQWLCISHTEKPYIVNLPLIYR